MDTAGVGIGVKGLGEGGARRLAVYALAALALLLAGCGGASSGNAPSEEAPPDNDASPRTTAAETTGAETTEPEVALEETTEPESTTEPRTAAEDASAPGGGAAAAGGELTVTFFDVGQGNAALLELPGGEDVLMDGGPGEAGPALVERLEELGVSELDAVVLSHADEDHVGGLVDVVESVPVETVYDSGYPHTTQVYDEFLAAVEESGRGEGPLHVSVQHAGVPGEAEELRKEVAGRFEPEELSVEEFSPVMASYTGPGLLGLAFYEGSAGGP